MKHDEPAPVRAGIAPDLQARTVVGVFDRFEQAEAAASALHRAKYPAKALSLVTQPRGSPPVVGAEETKAEEGVIAGASAGAILGGAIGLATVAIPGIGPLVAAGPIAATLGGALAGGALGGLAGSFVGLGIPEQEAREYAAAVRAGGVILAVRAPDAAAAERAEEILSEHRPRQVTSYTTEI